MSSQKGDRPRRITGGIYVKDRETHTKKDEARSAHLSDWVRTQVSQGENANQITAKLKEQGLIKNELAFKYYLKAHHVSGKLRAGSYQLSPAMDTETIVNELLNGVGDLVRFTIPEGYTLRDIADALAGAELMETVALTGSIVWRDFCSLILIL